jgi:DNA (cytosine-5)-methyltransferase 1
MTAFQPAFKLHPLALHLVNPTPNYRWLGGLIVDNFAGGGGASTGIWKALGVSPDIAVNHDAKALAMHEANHPETKHYNESVWDIDVRKATGGRPVLFGWFSPDCTHFSIARGSKPVKKNIRGLAWIVKKWAGQSDMAIFALENVKEFQTWGPLIAERDKKTGRVIKLLPDPNGGKDKKGNLKMIRVVAEPGERVPVQQQALIPDKKRSGKTFRQFLAQLREMGYVIEWNDKMRADDYGDPTQRKRLLMIGRKDGLPCDSSPVKTHGNPKAKDFNPETMLPWKTAGEHMDWSLECESIFKPGRKLAEKTLERIAKGIKKFVIDAGDDAFIVKVNHSGYDQFRGQSLDEPMQTITAVRGQGVVEAKLVMTNTSGHACSSVDEPLPTITTGNHHYEASAKLVAVGMKFRFDSPGWSMNWPVPTITGGGACQRDAGAAHALGMMTATLVAFQGTMDHRSTPDTSKSLDEPLTAITSKARHMQVSAMLKNFTGVVGQTMKAPAPTITATDHNSVVTADLLEVGHVQRDFGNSVGQPADAPLGAITAGGGGKAGVVTSHLMKLKGTCKDGQPCDEPIHTIQGQGNHYAEVRAFLMKYYATGAIGQGLDEPVHTIRAGDTFALVTIQGVDYQIVDIGMRMLQPHELYACQGFPEDYEHVDVGLDKPLTKAEQTRMVGNSVPPGMAAAWVRSNVPLWALGNRNAAMAA